MNQRKGSRAQRAPNYVERLRALWEELVSWRGQDAADVLLRSTRHQTRVDVLEGVFVDREPVFEASWPHTLCDAPDAEQLALITAGEMPGLRTRVLPGTDVPIIETYSRIDPRTYHPSGTLANPTPEEIRHFHNTGECS